MGKSAKKRRAARKKKKKETAAMSGSAQAGLAEGLAEGRGEGRGSEDGGVPGMPGAPSSPSAGSLPVSAAASGLHSVAEVARLKHIMGYHADMARADAIIHSDEFDGDGAVSDGDEMLAAGEEAPASWSAEAGGDDRHLKIPGIAKIKTTMAYHAVMARADAIIHSDADPSEKLRGQDGVTTSSGGGGPSAGAGDSSSGSVANASTADSKSKGSHQQVLTRLDLQQEMLAANNGCCGGPRET